MNIGSEAITLPITRRRAVSMSASEARIRANQANSLKSSGPSTPEGKRRGGNRGRREETVR